MLIGLHGKAGAGKDTVADYLYHRHSYGRIAFAGPLKDMLIVFGIGRHVLDDRDQKEQVIEWIGKSPRQLMQSLGTEWGRNLVGEDIWIRHAEHRLALQRRIGVKVCFTDCRFENEAAWIRAQGGVIWHIARHLDHCITPEHSSEDGVARRNAQAGNRSRAGR